MRELLIQLIMQADVEVRALLCSVAGDRLCKLPIDDFVRVMKAGKQTQQSRAAIQCPTTLSDAQDITEAFTCELHQLNEAA